MGVRTGSRPRGGGSLRWHGRPVLEGRGGPTPGKDPLLAAGPRFSARAAWPADGPPRAAPPGIGEAPVHLLPDRPGGGARRLRRPVGARRRVPHARSAPPGPRPRHPESPRGDARRRLGEGLARGGLPRRGGRASPAQAVGSAGHHGVPRERSSGGAIGRSPAPPCRAEGGERSIGSHLVVGGEGHPPIGRGA